MNKNSVTIQVTQRNGKKFYTSITGLADDLDKLKIVTHLKKSLRCNGFIANSDILGEIIMLTGNHKDYVNSFLLDEEICRNDEIIIKGI